MTLTHYLKSFSHGQITIPKEFREKLNLPQPFWLKVTLKGQKLVALPLKHDATPKDYAKRLLTIKADWFNPSDWKKLRSEINRRLRHA